MKRIPLTKGYSAIVDDADYPRVVAAGKWAASVKGRNVYATRYAPKVGGGQTTITMHKFLTGFERTDHINGNGLDNRRSNLRQVTGRQNSQNARAKNGGTSRFKGVHWYKRPDGAGRWRVLIRVGDRRMQVGVFVDEEAAARAYDEAARLHHGQFASLNFPKPGERGALVEQSIEVAA